MLAILVLLSWASILGSRFLSGVLRAVERKENSYTLRLKEKKEFIVGFENVVFILKVIPNFCLMDHIMTKTFINANVAGIK